MRLDPIVTDLCRTEVIESLGCIGTVLRRSGLWEDVDWVVAVTGATVKAGVGMPRKSPWCPESPWSSGEFGGLWELDGRHTLVLSHPKILRWRLPPSFCRPGREKHKTGVTLFSAVATMSTVRVPKIENRLFKASWGIRHSVGLGLFFRDNASAVTFLAPGRWFGMRRITNRPRRWKSPRVLLNREMEWVPPCLRM